MEYGTIDVIELLDDYTNGAGEKLLSVLIVFEQRDDADKAHHTMKYAFCFYLVCYDSDFRVQRCCRR